MMFFCQCPDAHNMYLLGVRYLLQVYFPGQHPRNKFSNTKFVAETLNMCTVTCRPTSRGGNGGQSWGRHGTCSRYRISAAGYAGSRGHASTAFGARATLFRRCARNKSACVAHKVPSSAFDAPGTSNTAMHADASQHDWISIVPVEDDPDPDAEAPLQPFLDASTVAHLMNIARQRGGGSSCPGTDFGRGKRRRAPTARMAASGMGVARHFAGVLLPMHTACDACMC